MPRAVDLEQKQRELIDASIDVIAEHGLAGATMRRISSQAGCTTGTLTHYFPHRNAILKETLTAVHEQAARRMVEIVRSARSAEGKLHDVLLESLPLDRRRLTEWRVWLCFWSAAMEDPELSAENRRRYRQWSRLVSELLTPLLPASRVAEETDRLVALCDGLGVGIVRQKVSARKLQAETERCRAILTSHLDGVIGRSAG